MNELDIVNITDEQRLDDDRPVDSSFTFLPDGLVEIFTSITGKYAAKNPSVGDRQTKPQCIKKGKTMQESKNL